MLGTYYYHEILRKTVISFGTLFNDIHVRHKDSSGSGVSDMKVALAYGPVQKFLARLDQQANLNKATTMSLPRMSFEMNNVSYDATRKAGITQTYKASDGTNLRKVFMPVPYNVGFELNIMTKLNDDALQIVEQILPYFQPSFNLTVDLVSSIGEKRDISVVLDSISFEDDYEGDYSTRRALIYTLNFTAKTYLFGPVAESPEGLIKKVQVDYAIQLDKGQSRRELRYAATPQARKDYDSDGTSTLTAELSTSQSSFVVANSGVFTIKDRVIIDDEIMRVNQIVDATTVGVDRAIDNTVAVIHGSGSTVNKLTAADDVLVDPDDSFGFNETSSYFADSSSYSPTRQTDI